MEYHLVTDTAHVATGLDTAEAASLISDLLTDDLAVGDQTPVLSDQQAEIETLPPHLRPKVKAQEDHGEDEPEETRSEDDGSEGADDGSKEGEGEDEPTQDDEGDEAPEAAPKTATVKIDGKEVEVPFEEVIAGYQRQADYSRKTQALAEERRAFDEVRAGHSTEVEAVKQERGQYKQLLTQLQTALDQLYPQEPDWAELYARDKNEFLLARDNWREYQSQKAAAKAELERVQSVERGEQTKALQQHIQQGVAKLVEWEPKWQDETVRRSDFAATLDYAKKSLGYTDAELANANDHRALYAVHKARLYDELMAQAKTVKQQAKPSTKKALPAGSSVQQTQTRQTRSKQDGMKRLVKGGGKVEDAAALMEDHLGL
jgi:hypothetical protein